MSSDDTRLRGRASQRAEIARLTAHMETMLALLARALVPLQTHGFVSLSREVRRALERHGWDRCRSAIVAIESAVEELGGPLGGWTFRDLRRAVGLTKRRR